MQSLRNAARPEDFPIPEGLVGDLLEAIQPSRWLRARGFEPDPWQERLADSRLPFNIVNCTRQAGKTTLVGGLVAHCVDTKPGALALVLAPSERQSQELLLKARHFLRTDAKPAAWGKKYLELKNGSRAFALPGSESTVRGFSAPDLIVVDEAGMADDALFYAVRPMLSTVWGKSRLILLSTPKGKRGFFFKEWMDAPEEAKTMVLVTEISRISKEWIEQERNKLPDWLFRQEYLCEFVDNELSVFGSDMIADAFYRGKPDRSLPLRPLRDDSRPYLADGQYRGMALQI